MVVGSEQLEASMITTCFEHWSSKYDNGRCHVCQKEKERAVGVGS